MIEEIKGYKIGSRIFESKKEAEKYKYEKLDPIEIGDIVSFDGGFKNIFGTFGLQGKVIDIDGNKIWFVNKLPIEYENYPIDFIKRGGIYINDKLKEWEVMCRKRHELSRKEYSYGK